MHLSYYAARDLLHDSATIYNNMWNRFYSSLSPEGKAVISDVPPMRYDTGEGTGDFEDETTNQGLYCSEGDAQGWFPPSPRLFEPSDEMRCEENDRPRPGELSRQLSSGEEQERCNEIRPEGWTVDLQHGPESPFTRGSVSRGPTTSPSWKRTRGYYYSGQLQEGMQGSCSSRSDDSQELQQPTKKRRRSPSPTRDIQLQSSMGSSSDSDSMGTNEHREDSTSQSSDSECTLGSSSGSLERDSSPDWGTDL